MASKGKFPPGQPVAFTSLCRCTVVIPYFCFKYATSAAPAFCCTSFICSLSKLPSKQMPMLS